MKENAPIADAAARRRALAPEVSCIVQAPAGSGKTELLARRFLRLLAGVNHPEEIVAITFTVKAASEMRNRILGALDRACGSRPEVQKEVELWELARAALARDEECGWNLRQSPERLRLSTIDSLCASLSRQMPVLSRLGTPPAIVTDAGPLHREAARRLLARLETDDEHRPLISRLLVHLDNDLPKAEGLVAAMLARRDQWMRHLGSGRGTPDRARIEVALGHVIEDALRQWRATIPQEEVAEVLWLARFAAGNTGSVLEPEEIRAWRDAAALPGAAPGDLPAWRGLARMLMTKSGEWRRRFDQGAGFPAPGGAPDGAERIRRQDAKARAAALVTRLGDRPEVGARLARLCDLPPARYEDRQWDVVEALCHLLPLAAAELWCVFQARREVDFTEVAWRALRALGTPEEPTNLALALDYRIHHLLVDEFQDTSVSQFELLEQLTAGWEHGDGRTLFVVGDPMQSIYRFRQAEVGLFLRAWHRGIGSVALEPLRLTVNFRSQAGIVSWVNATFARVFPAAEDVGAGAVRYAAAEPWHPARCAPAVTVHPFVGRDDEAEAGAVVAIVREAMQDPAQETIAILVRARTHLAAIARRLRREGLPFRAVEIEDLAHRGVVQDLLALTRALVHPGDRLSWLAALRAPWCGLTLADLETLTGADPEVLVWGLIGDEERCRRLTRGGQARLERFAAVIGLSMARLRREPLRRIVEGAWIALGGPACLEDPTDLVDARAYLDLLEELEAGGDLADFGVLSAAVGRLFAAPDVAAAASRLQLMTIYKAKGLEFHTVIVPGLGKRPRRPEPPLLMWAERPTERGNESDLLLAPITESGTADEPILGFLKRYERDKRRYESGRLLYVAATRAIDRLHLLGHAESRGPGDAGAAGLVEPPDDSLLAHLWEIVRAPFADAARSARSPGSGEERNRVDPGPVLLRRLPVTWRLPELPAAAVWETADAASGSVEALPAVAFDWAQEVSRRVGTVVHRVLQEIGRRGAGTPGPEAEGRRRQVLARLLREAGVPPAQLPAAVSRAGEAVARTLSDPRGCWILDSSHRNGECELALSAVLDGKVVNVVLDRTFVDAEGVRWIIDYKTSTHEGGAVEEFLDRERERYRGQLERYARILARIDPRPVRLGLYFPLLGGWREWRPPTAADPG